MVWSVLFPNALSISCFFLQLKHRNENKLRIVWGWIRQKIKNNEPWQNLLVLIKKCVTEFYPYNKQNNQLHKTGRLECYVQQKFNLPFFSSRRKDDAVIVHKHTWITSCCTRERRILHKAIKILNILYRFPQKDVGLNIF